MTISQATENWWALVLFVILLILLFWTSGDFCSGHQSQDGPGLLNIKDKIPRVFIVFNCGDLFSILKTAYIYLLYHHHPTEAYTLYSDCCKNTKERPYNSRPSMTSSISCNLTCNGTLRYNLIRKWDVNQLKICNQTNLPCSPYLENEHPNCSFSSFSPDHSNLVNPFVRVLCLQWIPQIHLWIQHLLTQCWQTDPFSHLLCQADIGFCTGFRNQTSHS